MAQKTNSYTVAEAQEIHNLCFFRSFRDPRVKEIPFLPDPELNDTREHYKPLSEMLGKVTSDVSIN